MTLMRMNREVSMHIKKTTTQGLMKSASLKGGICDEIGYPREFF